jgi:2,3-bisphosphoglycerate-independent phosphoglycerate mutase
VKTLVVVAEGAADRPQDDLGGRTPLEAARTPALDRAARDGRLGRVTPAPEGTRPEEGAFVLSLFGLDPRAHPDAGGAIEAAGLGVEVGSLDQVFRLALVTAHDDTVFDPTGGNVRAAEAALLLDALAAGIGDPDLAFLPGDGWRNLLVWRGARDVRVKTVPPFEVVGRSVRASLPRGTGVARLAAAVERSGAVLAAHEVNECRRDLGENPVTLAWPWAPGVATTLPSLRDRLDVSCAVVAASPSVRGAAVLQGATLAGPERGPGADPDLRAETTAALTALGTHDLVLLHVSAAADASHARDFVAKVRALERIDAEVIAPALGEAEAHGDLRVLLVAGEAVAVDSGRHLADPVPFAVVGPGARGTRGGTFGEASAKDTGFHVERAWQLLDYALHL